MLLYIIQCDTHTMNKAFTKVTKHEMEINIYLYIDILLLNFQIGLKVLV